MDDDDGDRPNRPAQPLPFPDSLCHRCVACRVLEGRQSTFLMCTALPQKYPRQPVLACVAFEPRC